MKDFLEQIPDSIKVAGATSPSIMTLFGVPMEQWTYVASAVVSVMFIIEKMPTVIQRIKQLVEWIKDVKRKKS